ncbi:hypothetical protein PtA15_16A194 [Puccinia triticina]|uniref:Secreted protein n=1 Tax=Puccinia triticina TaxID=208348 RepID=A0ABY7D3U3_9BASI|nr:uncharacterized protein PtA15_16A194 [Puccinia triticina]WAQ92288.1 hypothetical protein PtA15_16A194 [Puccinia triticina]
MPFLKSLAVLTIIAHGLLAQQIVPRQSKTCAFHCPGPVHGDWNAGACVLVFASGSDNQPTELKVKAATPTAHHPNFFNCIGTYPGNPKVVSACCRHDVVPPLGIASKSFYIRKGRPPEEGGLPANPGYNTFCQIPDPHKTKPADFPPDCRES